MLLYCYSSLRQAFSNNGTHCTSTSSSGTIGNHILFWISHSMHVLLWFEGLILTVWLFVRTLWFNCWFNKPLTKITGQKFAAVKLIRCWKLKQTNKKKKLYYCTVQMLHRVWRLTSLSRVFFLTLITPVCESIMNMPPLLVDSSML